eukprot:6196484-Pleurochrysis_carterae.AAC.1
MRMGCAARSASSLPSLALPVRLPPPPAPPSHTFQVTGRELGVRCRVQNRLCREAWTLPDERLILSDDEFLFAALCASALPRGALRTPYKVQSFYGDSFARLQLSRLFILIGPDVSDAGWEPRVL